MKTRKPVDSLGIYPELQPVVKEVLEGMAAGDCLTLEQLTDFADGTLRGEKRAEVQNHLRRCPSCASLVVDIRQLFEPVRRLHEGWFGWRGALLAARGRLQGDEILQNAWQQHLERCQTCQEKLAVLVGGWTGLWLAARRPLYGFATGVTATVIVMLTVLRPVIQQPVWTTKDSTTGSKTEQPWPVAPQVLDRFVHPNSEQLPFVIQYWEQAAEKDPDNLTPLAALKQFYAQQAAQEQDLKKRQAWQEKEKAVTERLRRLLSPSQPKPDSRGEDQ